MCFLSTIKKWKRATNILQLKSLEQACRNSPICMQISPIAQVALLQTEMNSGFRFVPRIGMNSAVGQMGEKRFVIHL